MYIEPESGTEGNAAFLNIDYEEFKPETYKGVNVAIRDPKNELVSEAHFDSLDEAEGWGRENANTIYYMSSFDNFIADGGTLPE